MIENPFPLSDEQVIDSALQCISSYASSHRGPEINFNDCLQLVMNEVKKIYWNYRRSDYKFRRIPETTEEYLDIYNRIYDKLRDKATKRIRSLMKMRKMAEINATTAGILIGMALHERGMTYSIETQAQRAKIHVKITDAKMFSFNVKYKEINAGMLDEILDSVQVFVEQLQTFDRDVQIWKTRYKKCLEWKN